MSLPLVSVVIPTYNYARYIREAIDSVLQQEYPTDKIEIVIVDDGSTDNTQEVLQDLIDKGIVQYYYQDNKGKANATYHAIQKSSGKYIFNLDADDWFLPGKIANTVKVFEEDTEIVHVANPAKFIIDGKEAGQEHFPEKIAGKKNDGKEVLRFFYTERMLFGGGSTFAGRAAILRNISMQDAVDMYTDEFLVMATLNQGATFFLTEPMSVWRGHNNNYTVQTLSEAKYSRLTNSSKGMYDAVVAAGSGFSPELQKLYALHHFSRTTFLKETVNRKGIKDILAFAKFCFLSNRYPVQLLRRYSAFNRLLPTGVIQLLKRK